MGDTDFQIFLKDVAVLDYAEAYDRWNVFLDSKEQEQPQRFAKYLTHFLELYPFSFIHWIKYLALCTEDLGKAYQVALEHMPRNPKLWRLYLDYLHDLKNPVLYKKELERAILEIGADINSYNIFEEYYVLITEDNNKWDFFKKLFTRALIGLEKFMEKFNDWITNLPPPKLHIIYAKETRGATAGFEHNQIEFLKGQIERTYKKSLEYREKRVQLEDKIKHYNFTGKDPQRQAEYEFWKEYIALSRKQAVVENTSYCYQRALTCQTEQLELWEQAFHFLENQTGKYDRVLSILRNNKTFFIHFSSQLYFYWCDLEERLNPKNSRQMYIVLEEFYKSETPQAKHIEAYLRHIQFELRDNQLANAKSLYDSLLLLYQGDLELLSFIVVEYANFFLRRYKDLDYPKKLLKTYFQALPYNDTLFTNYLEFSKHFENIDGYYDELMNIVGLGLAKAKKNFSEKQYERVISLVKNYLRSSLSSIYLIKMSEKRMIDIEQKLKRGEQPYE